jgi:hypothetical protein
MIAEVDLKTPAKLAICDKSLNADPGILQFVQVGICKSLGAYNIVKQPAPHPATRGCHKTLFESTAQPVIVHDIELDDHIALRSVDRLKYCAKGLLSVYQ